MICEMINETRSFLPLFLKSIEWNDPILLIIGSNWNFSTVSSWRIIKDNKLTIGCYDQESFETLKLLENESIISIEIQSAHLQSDPVFIFSNGYKLEVFATTYLEPWVFGCPSGLVYVSSPS